MNGIHKIRVRFPLAPPIKKRRFSFSKVFIGDMKKLFNLFAVVGVVLSLLVGCTTLSNLTPAQIQSIGVVLTQTADQGAVYAIQQDRNTAQYFKIADATIDTFLLGTDLSPASLQAALAKTTGTNQWVNLAISGVIVAYDVSYQQYVAGQVNSNAVAVAWIGAVESGFKQALAQTGTGLRASRPSTPYFVKADGKTLDLDAIKAKVKAARK